jgi:hypothetical protein
MPKTSHGPHRHVDRRPRRRLESRLPNLCCLRESPSRRRWVRALFAEDRSAFIETIEVSQRDRQAEKLERLASQAELEYHRASWEADMWARAMRTGEPAIGDSQSASGARRWWRRMHRSRNGTGPGDTDPVQRQLNKTREELARKRARGERLRQEARERGLRSQTIVMHRLHSGDHYLDCSERRFVQWLNSQRLTPVRLTTKDGTWWWWFLDRFWWDDEGLAPKDVRARVLDLARRHREKVGQATQARSDVLGEERRVLPDSLLHDLH